MGWGVGGFNDARRGFAILVLALGVGGAGAASRRGMEPRRVRAMGRGNMTILFPFFLLTEMEDARTLNHEKCGYDTNGENATVRICTGSDNLEVSKVVGWSMHEYPRIHAPNLGRVEVLFRMREREFFTVARQRGLMHAVHYGASIPSEY